jgi:hypothetical protein
VTAGATQDQQSYKTDGSRNVPAASPLPGHFGRQTRDGPILIGEIVARFTS